MGAIGISGIFRIDDSVKYLDLIANRKRNEVKILEVVNSLTTSISKRHTDLLKDFRTKTIPYVPDVKLLEDKIIANLLTFGLLETYHISIDLLHDNELEYVNVRKLYGNNGYSEFDIEKLKISILIDEYSLKLLNRMSNEEKIILFDIGKYYNNLTDNDYKIKKALGDPKIFVPIASGLTGWMMKNITEWKTEYRSDLFNKSIIEKLIKDAERVIMLIEKEINKEYSFIIDKKYSIYEEISDLFPLVERKGRVEFFTRYKYNQDFYNELKDFVKEYSREYSKNTLFMYNIGILEEGHLSQLCRPVKFL